MNDREERLEAVRRELEAQNEKWRRASEALSEAGEILVAVPADLFEALTAPLPAAPAPTPTTGIRA